MSSITPPPPPQPGIDLDTFLHPTFISKSLICPISHLIPTNPSITPCDHLFCREALIKWLTKTPKCPSCNAATTIESIHPPNRIITNLLGELHRFCENRASGCGWTGQSDNFQNHLKTCDYSRTLFHSPDGSPLNLQKVNENLLMELRTLEEGIDQKANQIVDLESQNQTLQNQLDQALNAAAAVISVSNSSARDFAELEDVLAEKETEIQTLTSKLSRLKEFTPFSFSGPHLNSNLLPNPSCRSPPQQSNRGVRWDPRNHKPHNNFHLHQNNHSASSTSEGSDNDNNASNTDCDGDVSSVDGVRSGSRRAGSKYRLRHPKHRSSSSNNSNSNNSYSAEAAVSDVGRITGLREAQSKMGRLSTQETTAASSSSTKETKRAHSRSGDGADQVEPIFSL